MVSSFRCISFDTKRHHTPHVHARYQDSTAVIALESGEVLEGCLPPGKLRLVQAWVEIHREDLMADWNLAVAGQQVLPIEPLR